MADFTLSLAIIIIGLSVCIALSLLVIYLMLLTLYVSCKTHDEQDRCACDNNEEKINVTVVSGDADTPHHNITPDEIEFQNALNALRHEKMFASATCSRATSITCSQSGSAAVDCYPRFVLFPDYVSRTRRPDYVCEQDKTNEWCIYRKWVVCCNDQYSHSSWQTASFSGACYDHLKNLRNSPHPLLLFSMGSVLLKSSKSGLHSTPLAHPSDAYGQRGDLRKVSRDCSAFQCAPSPR